MGSGLVSLHLRSIFTDKFFTMSRNWLALKGKSLQGQQGPKCYQNTKIKDMVSTLAKKLKNVFVLVCSRNICLCTFHSRLREGNLDNPIRLQEYLQLTLLR